MSAPRGRPRLARTLQRARWGEYRIFLHEVLAAGYQTIALEDWIDAGRPADQTVLTMIMRRDVDQHPLSALRMLAIEQELEVRSTWYFRWRTAHPLVVERVRDAGLAVGLHYETLTRQALERGVAADPEDELLTRARETLRTEIEEFARAFGPIRSICPHGDTRVPSLRNADLLHGEDCSSFGIAFDGNEAMRGVRLGHWLTDRSAAEGGWAGGTDPLTLLRDGVSPILCVAHPNNWVAGLDLWGDRLAAKLLPSPRRRRASFPIRTGPDTPPHV